MSFKNMLTYVAAKTGNTSLNDDATRAVLAEYINNGAAEVWKTNDLPGCWRECYVKVLPNKTIALPGFIGELRAIRDARMKLEFNVQTMMPRYTGKFWASYWRNWRFTGYSPLSQDLTSAGPLTFLSPVVDGSVIVITGQTDTSLTDSEEIVINASSVTGTKTWMEVKTIKYATKLANDIVVLDSTGIQVATLYNTLSQSKYAVYDISSFPTQGPLEEGKFLIEILFKIPLERLVNDDDELPVPDIEIIVQRKAVQLWFEDDDTKQSRAAALDARVSRDVEQLQGDKESGIQKMMKFSEHKFIGLRRKYNYNKNWNGPSR